VLGGFSFSPRLESLAKKLSLLYPPRNRRAALYPRILIISVLPLLLASCARDALDPFALAPSTPFSSWTPMKGSRMVSSKFCETLLPPSFQEGEMNLAELIDIGLQNNPTTKQTWANARIASAQYGQSLSSFYPNVQFTSQYTRQRGEFIQGGSLPPIPYLTTTAGPDCTLTYTLFDFGQRTSQSIAAREALYAADWTHNQQIQAVIQLVMNDYYSYIYQIKVQRSMEANLENAKASLDAANQRFALGLAALGDVAQARTQYLQSKINLTTQRQTVENAFAALATDLGLPANVGFKVHAMPEEIESAPCLESVDALVALAQTRRPDLLAAEATIRSKELLVKNARRAVYPVIATNFDVGKYWFDHGRQESRPHWTAELTISFPIFQGFYYKNGIKKAEANLEYSRAAFLQTELSIIQMVTTAHMSVKTSALNLKDTDEYLQSAQTQFEISLSGYKAGVATILDLLSSQSALADARSQKASAQRAWYSALAEIAYATGCLCLPAEEACSI